jgi:hypothetical protein
MTQQGTKIFGFRIPLDPKIFVGILFAIGLLLAWHNFSGGSDDHPSTVSHPAAAIAPSAAPPGASSLNNQNIARRAELANRAKQGVLHFKPVDPTRGDVDPTLKLWLLDRVRSVKPVQGARNLFETGPELAQASALPLPKVKPMMPKPTQLVGPLPSATAMAPPPVNIPLRYYGFVKPSWRGDGNRGYFMEGENILMATEGDVLEGHFLVVALSPNKAHVEDIQLKQGQDLPLIPEAAVTQ